MLLSRLTRLFFLALLSLGCAVPCWGQGEPDKETRAQVLGLLDEFHAAVASGSNQAVMAFLDFHEAAAPFQDESLSQSEADEFITGFTLGLVDSFRNSTSTLESRTQIGWERSNSIGDWVVTELQVHGVEYYKLQRFWIAQGEAHELKLVDFGDAYKDVRFSMTLAGVLGPNERIRKGCQAFLVDVAAIDQLILEGDIDGVARAHRRLIKWTVIDSLVPLKRSYGVQLAALREDWGQVLALARAWDDSLPKPPIVDRLVMEAYVSLEQFPEAKAAATAFMQRVGTTPYALTVMGISQRGMGELRDSIFSLDAALRFDSNALTSLTHLAGIAEARDEAMLRKHLRGFGPLEDYFDNFGGELYALERWETLEMFCEELKRRNPDDINYAYYTALRLLYAEYSPRRAFALLLQVLPRAGEEQAIFLNLLLEACSDSIRIEGDPARVWIYDKLPEHQNAIFVFFAEELAWNSSEDLQAWNTQHGSLHPDDPELLYYLGVVAEMQSRYGQAADLYAKAQSAWTAEDPNVLDGMLGRQVECLLMDGQLAYAFHELEPHGEVWAWILDVCYQSDFVGLLQMALELREVENSKDPELPLWRGFHAWLVDDYAAASAYFKEGDLWLPRMKQDSYQGNFFHYAVRSHLRAGSLDLALALGIKISEQNGEPFFEALARAALKQDQRAQTLLLQCLSADWSPADLRDDAELEPHLDRPGFAQLRALLAAE